MKAVCVWLLALPGLSMAEDYIPRAKLTDGELTCQQIYTEVTEMEKILGTTSETAKTSEQVSKGAELAHGTAGHAAHAAAIAGNTGAAIGIAQAAPFLGMFGNAAKVVADSKTSDAKSRLEQAKARHEHLTGLFGTKGCKASEMKEAGPAKSK